MMKKWLRVVVLLVFLVAFSQVDAVFAGDYCLWKRSAGGTTVTFCDKCTPTPTLASRANSETYDTSEDCATGKTESDKVIYCKCASGTTPTCTRSTKSIGCPSSTTHGRVCYSTQYDDEDSCKNSGISPTVTPAPSTEAIQTSIKAEELTSDTLASLNPLSRSNVKEFQTSSGRTPGNFVSRLVKNIVFPTAGLLLFLYIVWGGFQVVQGGTLGKDNLVDAGKQRVTAAIIGFLLLFGSYWMWSLVELALGLNAT